MIMAIMSYDDYYYSRLIQQQQLLKHFSQGTTQLDILTEREDNTDEHVLQMKTI